eukprot:8625965-Karenia_brevis.AAC.1
MMMRMMTMMRQGLGLCAVSSTLVVVSVSSPLLLLHLRLAANMQGHTPQCLLFAASIYILAHGAYAGPEPTHGPGPRRGASAHKWAPGYPWAQTGTWHQGLHCLLYTSPSPRDTERS